MRSGLSIVLISSALLGTGLLIASAFILFFSADLPFIQLHHPIFLISTSLLLLGGAVGYSKWKIARGILIGIYSMLALATVWAVLSVSQIQNSHLQLIFIIPALVAEVIFIAFIIILWRSANFPD